MANLQMVSTLGDQTIERAQFSVEEVPDYGLIRLQTFHREAGQVEKLSGRIGIDLPGPGRVKHEGDMQLFWSAPGEWVIAVPSGHEQKALARLSEKLDGLFTVLTLITDSRAALKLSGGLVREILARGSSVDFHPSVFGLDNCISTRLTAVPVMLVGQRGNDCLLLACRSVVAYLFDWFRSVSRDC